MTEVTVKIPDGKLDFFMELFKKLGLKTTNPEEFPSMTIEEMIEQADIAEDEINKGKTTSHDDFHSEFKKW